MNELEEIRTDRTTSLSRRDFMLKGGLATAGALSIPAVLAACGGDDEEGAATQAQPTGQAEIGEIRSVTHGTPGDPFWAVYRKGLEDGSKQFGVELTDEAPEQFSVQALVDLLNSAVAAKPAGIIVTITDPAAVEAPLRQAIEQGIPVIAVNVPDTREDRIPYLFYVGGDEELGGRTAGQRILQEVTPTRAACAIQEVGHVGLQARCKGFTDVMEEAGVPADTVPIEGGDPTRSAEVLRGYFTDNPDTDALFTLGPQGATPAIQVLEEQGLTDKITHMTFDLSQEQVDQIKEGNILGTVGQQQYLQGYLPILFLRLNLEHGFTLAADVLTGPFVVDSSNLQAVEQGVKDAFF
ncbi:MAG: substrate-binding domain-containing protein [Acidimicrobiia bacterium]